MWQTEWHSDTPPSQHWIENIKIWQLTWHLCHHKFTRSELEWSWWGNHLNIAVLLYQQTGWSEWIVDIGSCLLSSAQNYIEGAKSQMYPWPWAKWHTYNDTILFSLLQNLLYLWEILYLQSSVECQVVLIRRIINTRQCCCHWLTNCLHNTFILWQVSSFVTPCLQM